MYYKYFMAVIICQAYIMEPKTINREIYTKSIFKCYKIFIQSLLDIIICYSVLISIKYKYTRTPYIILY